ncbi:MAG: DNA polymerase IV, partial [Pseudomonadota bacterium]|nr:DNA polymerase IV [Pseudomonadota bacterium]
MNKKEKHWPRAIILIDMNAFFASIEQLDFPELRGQPVAVTNGKQGTCIITCSYEARRFGIKTGMRWFEARELCPELVQAPSRPQRYAEISSTIMEGLQMITPDIEVFSVDEAFLDVTRCQRLHGSPIDIARWAQQRVFDVSGLSCSVGLSGDKTTAKFAAKLVKPEGFTVIYPWDAKARLRDVPVTELCGIAKGIGRFLASYGVIYCGDMDKLPISILAKRFGNLGRRIWYMCQGADPDPLHTHVADPKSIGHGKVIPPNTTHRALIETYLLHMSEKVGARLRRHNMAARHFFIGLRSLEWGWIASKEKLLLPSNDGQAIYRLCQDFMTQYWHQQPISQVQVTALDPHPDSQQMDLFMQDDAQRRRLNDVVDDINQTYGEFVVAPARLLGRSSMPNVIS